jgi:hypothetical protein
MIDRCYNEEVRSYPLYGGRGIRVCDRWLASFEAFLGDMGLRPSRKHSLDRKNGELGYEPSNCRWATPNEQGRNTSRNHRLTFEGETLCLSEWAERKKIPETTLRARVRYGWSPDRVLSTPVDQARAKGRQGAKTGKVLSPEDVREIRALCERREGTHAEIAAKFGVSKFTVDGVSRKASWKHV